MSCNYYDKYYCFSLGKSFWQGLKESSQIKLWCLYCSRLVSLSINCEWAVSTDRNINRQPRYGVPCPRFINWRPSGSTLKEYGNQLCGVRYFCQIGTSILHNSHAHDYDFAPHWMSNKSAITVTELRKASLSTLVQQPCSSDYNWALWRRYTY